MVNNLPEWHNAGIEPPNSLKLNGWQKEDRPPAQYFNWWMNRSYLALLAAKQHIDNKNNPHNVTKAHIGLNNVLNNEQATKTEFDNHVQSALHTRFGVATGTNNLVLNIPNIAQNLVVGQAFRFKNTNANTTQVTLRINENSAAKVLRSNGLELSAGVLRMGGVYTVCYDGANFILQAEGGEYGTATSSDVLVGRTIGTETGIVEGKMPVIQPVTTLLNAGAEFNIPLGYHNGRGFVRVTQLASQTSGTALAAEIAAGKTAWVNGFRVTGTAMKYSGQVTAVAPNQTVWLPNGYYESATVAGILGNITPITLGGLRMATGVANVTERMITVTGLAFRPRIILTRNSRFVRKSGAFYIDASLFPNSHVYSDYTALTSGGSGLVFESEVQIYTNGFTIMAMAQNEQPVSDWIALG